MEKYPSGFKADIICNPGFIRYSGKNSTCTELGTWDTTPRCESKQTIDILNFKNNIFVFLYSSKLLYIQIKFVNIFQEDVHL